MRYLAPHVRGMEIVIELNEFNGIERIGIPLIATAEVPQRGFEVALVGEFKDELAIVSEDAPYPIQDGGHILKVVDDTNHRGGVKGAGEKWHAVSIGGDVEKARITELLPRKLQLFQRIVEKHHLLEHAIFVGYSAEAGADFQQSATTVGQELSQNAALYGILVVTSPSFPEILPIGRIAVVQDSRSFAHVRVPKGGMSLSAAPLPAAGYRPCRSFPKVPPHRHGRSDRRPPPA